MSNEANIAVYLVYEPEKGSDSGFHVAAESFDEAAMLYCDLENVTKARVTVRCVNQETNEWRDVKMHAMPFAEKDTSDWSIN